MISPNEIVAKAERRYRDVLKVWLSDGDASSLFPMQIRFRHIQSRDDSCMAANVVRALRVASKSETGSGFSVEWRTVRSSTHGRNEFPEKISFETLEDYLVGIGKQREFDNFTDTVERIRDVFPQIEPWLRREIARTVRLANEGLADGLIEVCQYLLEHPCCGLFARELPLPVDTKFVERHAADYLRPWLDLILPAEMIRAEESHFARRFGLSYDEPLIRIRFLDESLSETYGVPWNDFALSLSKASKAIDPGLQTPTVFIVENLVNALTFPTFPNGIVIGGLGNGAGLFRYLEWIPLSSAIYYWGDIDAQGFEILSTMRRWFPDMESILMDKMTFDRFVDFQVTGTPSNMELRSNLTADESEMAAYCLRCSARLEQEKIPQIWVVKQLSRLKKSQEENI